MLKGSAVCTRHDIVCLDPDCAEIGVANLCHMSQVQAYYDLTMTALFLIQVMVTACVQNKVSNKLDESIQTARDYSVRPDPLFSPPPLNFKCFAHYVANGNLNHFTAV